MPYGVGVAHFLVSYDDPAVTQRLLAEMHGADRVLKLALLHVLGMRADPTVDAALRDTLRDPRADRDERVPARALRATRAMPTAPSTSTPTAPRCATDSTTTRTFDDPFYHRSFRTQDFVLAAFIRLTGPDRFTFPDPDLAAADRLRAPALRRRHARRVARAGAPRRLVPEMTAIAPAPSRSARPHTRTAGLVMEAIMVCVPLGD